MSINTDPSPPPLPITEHNFFKLKEAVLQRRPILREILQKRGQKTLQQYAHDYISVNLNPPIQQRQDELIAAVLDSVAKRLGQSIAAGVAAQLRKYYFVSTTDHHGPIVNQSFCNANLMVTTPYLAEHDPVLQYVVVLACANVSLGNITFPRGLIFHNLINNKLVLQRLSFLPSNAHSAIVYNFRPYTSNDIAKMKGLLRDKVYVGQVTSNVAEQLVQLLDDVYSQPAVLACTSFSDQVIITNYYLWQKYFVSSGVQPAQLVYLEQEDVVCQLLLRHHLDSDTTIHHMLFDPAYEALLGQYFDGIMGAFTLQQQLGTYLFWGIIPGKNYRVQLWKRGQELVASDGSLRLSLTSDAIRTALESKQIVPSLLLVFTTLCFYYGLKCLGGFNQVNYLTFMKNAYIKMQVDRGNYRSIEVCARAQTKEMNDGFLVAFAESPAGAVVPVAGLDLYLYGRSDTWSTIVQETNNITLAEAINPSLPEFYRFTYPAVERRPELNNISAEAVAHFTQLDQKIKACVTLV